MLLLLLRLLTAPASIFPAAAIATVTQPQVAHVDSASLSDARARQAEIDAGPEKIRALVRVASDTQFRASCVAQRLAEAQVHVALARDEMQRLTDPGASAGDGAHALRRLALLAERTREVERAAHLCVDSEESSITATKTNTGVPPAIERRGDVTAPPPLPRPCPGGTVCTVITVP
jgi:hypothetical protein